MKQLLALVFTIYQVNLMASSSGGVQFPTYDGLMADVYTLTTESAFKGTRPILQILADRNNATSAPTADLDTQAELSDYDYCANKLNALGGNFSYAITPHGTPRPDNVSYHYTLSDIVATKFVSSLIQHLNLTGFFPEGYQPHFVTAYSGEQTSDPTSYMEEYLNEGWVMYDPSFVPPSAVQFWQTLRYYITELRVKCARVPQDKTWIPTQLDRDDIPLYHIQDVKYETDATHWSVQVRDFGRAFKKGRFRTPEEFQKQFESAKLRTLGLDVESLHANWETFEDFLNELNELSIGGYYKDDQEEFLSYLHQYTPSQANMDLSNLPTIHLSEVVPQIMNDFRIVTYTPDMEAPALRKFRTMASILIDVTNGNGDFNDLNLYQTVQDIYSYKILAAIEDKLKCRCTSCYKELEFIAARVYTKFFPDSDKMSVTLHTGEIVQVFNPFALTGQEKVDAINRIAQINPAFQSWLTDNFDDFFAALYPDSDLTSPTDLETKEYNEFLTELVNWILREFEG